MIESRDVGKREAALRGGSGRALLFGAKRQGVRKV